MSFPDMIFENSNWLTAVLASAVCLAVYAYFQWSRMPPGPIGLPYLGYYPYLSDDCHLELLELSKKYGKVFCFRYMGQLYAHIPDIKGIREVSSAKSDCFDVRPTTFTLFQDIFGSGIFFLNGEEWKMLRKFFVQQMKEFGFGKKTQEDVMVGSLKKIVGSLRESCGRNFDALNFFAGLSSDIVRQMIFGSFALDDNDTKKFTSAYKIITEFNTGTRILAAGPMLKYILMNFAPEYRSYRKYKKQVEAVMTKIVRQHEREFDKNHIRNMVDSFINERKSLEAKKDPKAKLLTELGLVGSLLQFIGDGTLGPSWLTAAILNAIASRPDIQKAIQIEIDEAIGRNRFPSMDDRSKLPFTKATIYEGLRTVKFFPLLPIYECTKETTIGGCRIPKGTVTAFNAFAAFHDPAVYYEPHKFDPTRFLSVDGKKPRCEIPIIFGVGRRSCGGESLVNMQIMLYITTVLQHFDLHPDDKTNRETEEWSIFFRATPRAT